MSVGINFLETNGLGIFYIRFFFGICTTLPLLTIVELTMFGLYNVKVVVY